jgi:hypothetical protein
LLTTKCNVQNASVSHIYLRKDIALVWRPGELHLLDQVAPLQCSAFSLLEHAVEINEAGDSPAAVRNEGALRNSGAVEEVADTDTTLD